MPEGTKRPLEEPSPVAPHVFVGGPSWESRPDVPPMIDVLALEKLAAEVNDNGIKVLACVNKTLILEELAAVCGCAAAPRRLTLCPPAAARPGLTAAVCCVLPPQVQG